jgi:hypothetical protein
MGRKTITAQSDYPVEARFLTIAIFDGKFHTVVWTWRGKSVSSSTRIRNDAQCRNSGESKSNWAQAAAVTDAKIEEAIASDPDEAGMVVDYDVMEFFRNQSCCFGQR